MFKISFKRSVAVLLTLVLLLTSLPVTAFAETASASTETEDEYIYYSDLFYGYSYYLNDLEFLSNHVEAQGAMNTSFNQYLDSPQFTWAAISKHISLTTSMSDLMIAYSDMLGLTNVTYTNNLDAANKKFVEELFVLKTGDIDSISKDTKCVGQFKKILSTLQKVWKAIYDANDIKTYDTFVDLAYADLQTYCTNLKPLLPSLKSGTYTAINELLSKADDTQEILDLFTALIISLGMEEVRLDTIQEIISTQKSDSILYEGMNRLHSQLKNGFVGYFIGTYFEDKAIEEVAKHTSKFITKTIMEEVTQGIGASSAEAMTSIFGAVTASISLLNTIVFDWIFGDQIPSIEDYQVTMILAQYSNLMHDSVVAKQAVFQAPFETKEIEKYETLMNAYAASMRCALDECAALVDPISSTTEQNIKNTKTLFGDNFYNSYIDGVKSTVKSIPQEQRVITNYNEWEITYENASLKNGSDTIEDSTVYFVNHNFYGNIKFTRWYEWAAVLHGTMTIPQNEELIINGDLSLKSDGQVYLINDGILTVNGSLKVITNASFTNNGSLTVGDSLGVTTENFGDAIIRGNITTAINNYGNLNVAGDAVIANNKGLTIVEGEGTVVNGSNEGDLCFKGNLNVSGNYINNGVLLVNGNTTIKYGSYSLENNSIATLMGDLTLNHSSGMITTSYAYLIMEREDSVLNLGGDYLASSDSCSSEITNGTIILNGSKQQEIKNLQANNIIVENTNGIKYLSSVRLYGHYNLNGHPLDNNGYSTYVASESATFDNKSDFKMITFPNDHNFNYVLTENFTGDMVFSAYGSLNVPIGSDITICGNIDFGNEVQLIIDGSLKVVGDVVCNYGSPKGTVNIYVDNCLNVRGNLIMRSDGYSRAGVLKMNNESSKLHIGGDFKYYYYKIYDVGKIILDGYNVQNIYSYASNFPVMVIDNTSRVVFESDIYSSTLFDHRGNNFTLYNNGSGSTFVDYDGDGLKDNVDPHPTINEKCINGHNYGDWSTVTEATPASTGIKHKLCTECGDEVTEEIPAVEGLAFKGASLTLHHNLAINYKVDKALFETVGYTNPYVVFEVGGKTTTVKAYAIEGERYVFRFRNIAPNQMNDTIFATLYATYNGVEYASETREYSVAEYCYSTLNKYSADDYAELRTLLVDLLHYGAQSQLYTKYNVGNLVTANLTEAQLAWGTAEDPTLTNSLNTAYKTVENPLITWKGASLNLNDSVAMRFKFITEDIEGLSLKITGETDEWNITSNNFVLEDGVYSVRFSGLNAGQMSEKVYLTMYKDGVAVSNTVCYSIESYAYSKQDSTIEHLSALVKAMMKYGNSAHSYVN